MAELLGLRIVRGDLHGVNMAIPAGGVGLFGVIQ